jgi:hypothetical protein
LHNTDSYFRLRNEIDRGYEVLRRIALEALLDDSATGASGDIENKAAAAAASLSSMSPSYRQSESLQRNASLSPQRRGHRRTASKSPSHVDEGDNLGRPEAILASRQSTSLGARSLSPLHQATIGLLGAGNQLGGDQTAASTLSVVQAAINRQRLQVGEMKAALDAVRDENATLRKQLDTSNGERRRMERDIARVEEEREGM